MFAIHEVVRKDAICPTARHQARARADARIMCRHPHTLAVDHGQMHGCRDYLLLPDKRKASPQDGLVGHGGSRRALYLPLLTVRGVI